MHTPTQQPGETRGRPGYRGFTLIEILIVIATIALLAAILFPVFSRVRESARRSSCQSNMRQVVFAARMYAEDFDGKLKGGVPAAWEMPYEDYFKDKGILECPSATRKGSTRTSDYIINGYITSGLARGVNLKWFDNTRTAMIFDSDAQQNNRNWAFASTAKTPRPPYANPNVPASNRIALRHLGGSNVAFFDGHVKWLQADQLFVKESGSLINPTGIYDAIGNTTRPGPLNPSIWYTDPGA